VYVANLKGVEKGRIKSLTEAALEKTSLHDVRKRMIGNLSKGFKQRVGLAQALVSDPQILVLDEPTVGLDPKQVAEIRQLIRELRGQHTIILSTHILPEVQPKNVGRRALGHGQSAPQSRRGCARNDRCRRRTPREERRQLH
jgi:ABC-2 type transport system ATP-binding protein